MSSYDAVSGVWLGMVSERLQRIRQKINRREKKVRSNRRAKSRRIRRGEPDSATEAAQVKVRAGKKEAELSAEEARELADDAKTLVATELGVSRSESESVITKGAALLGEAGSQIGSLDVDGDGDTDLLTALDQPIDDGASRSSRSSGGSGISAKGTDSDSSSDEPGFDASEPIFEPMDNVGDASEPIFDPFSDE